MLMKNGDIIKKIWIILNTCSTYSVTNNLDYVEDVKNREKQKELTVLTNGVSPLFDWKGRLTFLPLNVHVNENFLATTISLKYENNVPGVHVTMDTLIEKAVNVILKDGTIFKFKECGSGIILL